MERNKKGITLQGVSFTEIQQKKQSDKKRNAPLSDWPTRVVQVVHRGGLSGSPGWAT